VAQYQVFLTLFIALTIRGNLLPGALWSTGLDAALIIVTMITPTVSFILHFKLPDWAETIMKQSKQYLGRLRPLAATAAPVHEARFRGGWNDDINNGLYDSDTIPPESFEPSPSTF